MIALDKSDSTLVRATETISSIGHCLRELIENSIDGGAHLINISITGNGLETITVSDNGCGIDRDGLSILCTEGVTSKEFGKDLSGGRGKALDAISALSYITIDSSADNSGIGYRLTFNKDGERSIQKISCKKGTSITVQSIYHSHPVRRLYCIEHKAKQSQELNEVVASFAISTKAHFSYAMDSKLVFQVTNPTRAQRIRNILGSSVTNGMISGVEDLTGWCNGASVEYFTSSPTTNTKGRIFIIINQRPATNSSLVKAVKQEFKLCAGPKSPTAIIYISAPRDRFDFIPDCPLIGVRFVDEPKLQECICGILGKAWKTTSETLTIPKATYETPLSSPNFAPKQLKSIRSSQVISSVATSSVTTEKLIRRYQESLSYKKDHGESLKSLVTDHFDQMEIIGQWNKSFIITKLGPDIYAIDQHAANEAANFEKLRKIKTPIKQRLLQPVVIKTTPEDQENAIEHIEQCRKLGFDYEVCDEGIKVTCIPNDVSVVNGIEDLNELLGLIHDVPNATPMTRNARIQMAFHACHSSVRVGDTLSKAQMKNLLHRMATSDYPWNCPHGRPTWCCIYSLEES